MANYPVHQLIGDVEFDLVVVIQSDFYDFIDTRVVIPIRPQSSSHLDELINPTLEFDGRAHVLLAERTGTIPTTALGSRRGDLKRYSVEISRALDRLMTGF
ncbi:MAG: CcdB family protein [Pseudomonadota bacterium]